MTDRLLYVALVLSVAGLVLLVFVSHYVEPPYIKVGGLDSGMLEKNVHLKGVVSGVHEFKGGSLLMNLSEDGSTVDVYLPYSVSVGLNKSSVDGSKVDVTGVIQLYQGRLEVVVSKSEDLVIYND